MLHSGRAPQIAALGGFAAKRRSYDLRQFRTAKNAEQLLAIVMEGITELRSNRLNAKDAAALAALANTAQALIKTHRLEAFAALIEEADRRRGQK